MNERLEDIINHRKAKLENFKAAGIDPYPSTTERTHATEEALEKFEELSSTNVPVTLVGRIRSMRGMGKLLFLHIDDGTGRIQVLLKSDSIGEDRFAFFVDNF